MKRTAYILLTVALAGAASMVIAQQPNEQVRVPFSDPSRPGTIDMSVLNGSITVKAENRADVAIVMVQPRNTGAAPQTQGGLRRLNQTAGMSVEERGNRMSISTSNINATANFMLAVPTRTNLRLNVVNGGAIVVEGVDGELEVNNVTGPVTMTNVGGSVVAGSVNDDLRVTMTRVEPQKAMAFTSVNGAVDVTLPRTVRANLKLRSNFGDVLSDFDIQAQAAPPARVEARLEALRREFERGGSGGTRIVVDEFVYGTVNGGGPEFELRTVNGNIYVRRGN